MVLLVVDGNSILNRAYYGVRPLTTSDGRATNGIFGFMNILLSMISEYKPDGVAVAFDVHAPTFRHKMFDGYKGTRKPAPPELLEQFEPLKELLRLLGYTVVEKEGYEADDILGTLSHACAKDDFCYISTGDRDSLQLVRENVNVVLATNGANQPNPVYTVAKIKEVYGVTPEQLIDIKAIQGDKSDNIPGVAGIGEKGAGELIREFGSVDYIYENIDTIDIKENMRAKLKASADNAALSKTLGTICLSAPIDTNIENYRIKKPDADGAARMLQSLEMVKILRKLDLESATMVFYIEQDRNALLAEIKRAGKAYFVCEYDDGGIVCMLFKTLRGVALVQNSDFMFISFVSDLMSDKAIEKYTDDSKRLYDFCDRSGIDVQNICFDTTLAAYLLDPEKSDYSLYALRAHYGLGKIKIEAKDDEAQLYAEQNAQYVAGAAVLETVAHKQYTQLCENEQMKLMREIEMPLARVLASMEREGFSIDKDSLVKFGNETKELVTQKLSRIYELAGCEFNVNSPKQLGEVLFSENGLGLKHGKKTKTGYSTNAEVLEKLKDEHPVIPEILDYRFLTKLNSTYCEGLLKVIDSDGRIHSTLNQTETRTGRISSSEPNLQNIPVRTPRGREMRKFFNAREGCVLVDADYSQIELRVLAGLADDKNMIAAFKNGDDIHAITASQVFGIPLEDITSEARRRAKAVNFGIVYGIGAFSLSNDVGCSNAEADRYIKSYLANYSGVAAFLENAKKSAKEKGYAETYYGRRRYLPELDDANAKIRAFGERVAMNMPIQGTAADIIKIAMIRVYERLAAKFPEAHLIMQIHDELIIETPEKDAEAVAALLVETMETACDVNVPLTVEAKCGKTWYDTK